MNSNLRTALLSATAALALAFGAAAAQAGDYDDYLAAQEMAGLLDAATGGDDLVSQAVEDAASEAAADALLSAIEEAADE
ncbi:MAG: hypothetical protein WC829_06295 [Hyphomicrobium sp.]|jgi:hypothetical protein